MDEDEAARRVDGRLALAGFGRLWLALAGVGWLWLAVGLAVGLVAGCWLAVPSARLSGWSAQIVGRESEVSSCDAQAEELGLTAKEIEVLVHRAELHVARTARLRRQKGPPFTQGPVLHGLFRGCLPGQGLASTLCSGRAWHPEAREVQILRVPFRWSPSCCACTGTGLSPPGLARAYTRPTRLGASMRDDATCAATASFRFATPRCTSRCWRQSSRRA